MPRNNQSKKQVSHTTKSRKADTSRTSSQGRKAASGGSPAKNNKGNRKEA